MLITFLSLRHNLFHVRHKTLIFRNCETRHVMSSFFHSDKKNVSSGLESSSAKPADENNSLRMTIEERQKIVFVLVLCKKHMKSWPSIFSCVITLIHN